MRYLYLFKFSILSFLAAFLLFGYSLLGISTYTSVSGFHIRQAFVGLFITALVVGLFLDLLISLLPDSWFTRYQFAIAIAVWSASIFVLALVYGGGGHGLGAGWGCIFRFYPPITYRLFAPSREIIHIILWGLFSIIQGAIIGFVIDFLRR